MALLTNTLGAALALAAVTSASADTDWTVRTTAYGWLTSISGTTTLGRLTTDVDANFSDTIDEMDSLFVLMAYTEGRHDRWGFYLDTIWMDIGFSGSTARLSEPIEGLSFTLDNKTGLATQLGIIEAGGTYEIRRWEGSGRSSSALDGIFGIRGVYAGLDLTFDVEGSVDLPAFGLELDGTRARARSGNIAFLDPIFGLRFRHEFAGGDRLQLRGDVGGFGAGSEFSWQLLATYSYDFDDGAMSAVIGYRALGIDYSQGDGLATRSLDLILHGPVLGFTFRW